MHIGMILDKPFPTDDRVEKEALSLIKDGFRVSLLCFTFGDLAASEAFKGIRVRRVYMPLFMYKKLAALILLLPFYNWFWGKHIRRFVREEKIDILHVHDLPLCGLAIAIKQQLNIPLVADMHENYPMLIEEAGFTNTFWGRLLISKNEWHHKEVEWLNQVQQIVIVANGMQKRLRSRLNGKQRFALVPNSPRITDILQMQQSVPVKPKAENGFMLFYFGGLDSIRGLETLIEAVALLKEEIPQLSLRIVGSGSLRPQLETQVSTLGISQQIEFSGWQPIKHLGAYIADADLCIIPHLKSPQTDNSSPNKLFIYMLFNKAIISSNCQSVQEVVRQANCGLVYESGDVQALAKRVRKLYRKPELRTQMAANGLRAVQENFDWDKTVTPLLKLYADLANTCGKEA